MVHKHLAVVVAAAVRTGHVALGEAQRARLLVVDLAWRGRERGGEGRVSMGALARHCTPMGPAAMCWPRRPRLHARPCITHAGSKPAAAQPPTSPEHAAGTVAQLAAHQAEPLARLARQHLAHQVAAHEHEHCEPRQQQPQQQGQRACHAPAAACDSSSSTWQRRARCGGRAGREDATNAAMQTARGDHAVYRRAPAARGHLPALHGWPLMSARERDAHWVAPCGVAVAPRGAGPAA